MMRICAAVMSLSILITACSGDPGPRTDVAPVRVERAGSAVHDGRVGAAAVLRVTGGEARGPIDLELSFIDHEGEHLATTRESLAFCAPRRDCFWAASFFADEYGGRRVRSVRVAVVDAEPFGNGDEVQSFPVRRTENGDILGDAPADRGTAYVVASVGERPRWGTSVNLTGDRAVTVPADLLPAIEGEDLSGFFYAGPGVPGD